MRMLRKISNFNLQGKEIYIFIFTFILLSVSVLTNSSIDSNGFLTTDSTHFLKFAENFKVVKLNY